MSDTRRVRVAHSPATGGFTITDAETGVPIRGVTAVHVSLAVNERPTAIATVMAPDVDLEVLAEMLVDPERLAEVLWRRDGERQGISWSSDRVPRWCDLPTATQERFLRLARAAFEFVSAFNRA